MSSEDNSVAEFLDDYFLESEEHLGSIRRHLLVMETFANRNRIDPGVIDELLGALHSLKGLSAMVGIREAEQVAHAMEDSLRDVKLAGTRPTDGAMEALAGGTSVIEQAIAARREQKPGPDINAVLSRLTAGGTKPKSLWRFRFSPSTELSARGIDVNSIRSRLQKIGQMLNSTPHIVDGGQVAFDFVVASDVDESRFSAWQLDGLTVARHNASMTEATEATEAAEAAEAPATPPPSVVRVDMKRLDDLMTMVSDLVISRSHVEDSLRRLEAIVPVSAWRKLQDANLLMQRQLRDLREGVMRVRMVPIGQIFERMPFVVRGLERESHKVVCLELTGRDIEIDKLLVEKMMDPLLHMVRNAITHGLEPSEDRVALGKTPEGHLRLHASTDAETVIIELEDDGRGVDIEQVASRSRTSGLIGSDETPGKTLDSSRVLQMICAPGFSTREEADMGAGHGLGMAVVKTTISGLGGTLAMDTLRGKGTRFTIRLPLTLAIVQAFIVYVDDQTFAVPRSAIHEVLRVETHAVTMLENKEVIPYRDGVLPIVYLNRFFRMKEKSTNSFHVFVAGSDSSPVGIAVDRIAGQREIVVRLIEDYLVRVPGIAGVTELGDGRPVLILDVTVIVDAASVNLTPELHIQS
jgi:two-component system chemotaxis sensor kinase CheA